MQITVKCFASLGKHEPADSDAYPVAQGTTVGQVIDALGIDREELGVTFVNGVHAKEDAVLKDGDRLGLFPLVGGG